MRKKLGCILLVDDNEPTNMLNKIVIDKMGCTERVEIALDGKEALDFLTTKENGHYPKPDLIFLDINMPEMSGWEFLKHYARLPVEQRGDIMIVMLTTSMNPDDEERAKNGGYVQSFLHKPLTLDKLKEILEAHFPTVLEGG